MTTTKAFIIFGAAATLLGLYLYTAHKKAKQVQENLTKIANDPGTKVAAPSAGTGSINMGIGWGIDQYI